MRTSLVDFLRKKYNLVLLKLPIQKHAYIAIFRLLLWVYPKFILIPSLKNIFKKPVLTTFKAYISFIPPTEGIGGQLCRYATTKILADKFNLKYLHSKFGTDFHCPNLDWQKFLGFSDLVQKLVDFNLKQICVVYLPQFDLRYLKKLQLKILGKIIEFNRLRGETLFLLTGYSFYPLNEYQNWQKLLREMRKDYFLNRQSFPIKNHINKNQLNIAVLIRRGEISFLKKRGLNQGKWRWVEIDWYVNLLNNLISVIDFDFNINVFSDANSLKELKILKKFSNLSIHLFKSSPTQPFEAFDNMVNADFLICGLSSFPYFAGSIATNSLKFVPPTKIRVNYFPQKGEKNWIFPDKNANLSRGDNLLIKLYLSKFNKK